MTLPRRLLAVATAAALSLVAPTAAHAGSSGGHQPPAKKAAATQKAPATQKSTAKSKADAARAAAAARKAAAKAHFAFPGTVVSADTSTVTLTRKERGLVVSRTFTVDAATRVQRNGVRVSLSALRPGDHAVAVGRRVQGVLLVSKLNANGPGDSATPTATIG